MALNLSAFKVALNELSSSTKFDSLVQAIQDAANNIGDAAYGAFIAGKIFDPTKIKQAGATAGQVIRWNGSIWTPSDPPNSAFTVIADTTLVAAGSIDFTSIPGTSKHLLIVLYARTAKVAVTDDLFVQLNGDSAANYDSYSYTANGTTPSHVGAETLGGTNMAIKNTLVGASATANVFGTLAIWIPNYADTVNNKQLHLTLGRKTSTVTGGLAIGSAFGAWRANSAITRVFLNGAGGNFSIGTRATLYGV